MANIPIWPGSSSFSSNIAPTPFGFYDDDLDFSEDADKVATWCAQRLGYPLIDIELRDINFFSCFEEAVTEYGAQVYNYKIIDNLPRLVGSVTGSALNQVHVTQDLSPNLSTGNDYGSYGAQGEERLYSASLDVKAGRQKYDLVDSGLVTWETGSAQITTGELKVRIKKIYHYTPAAINRYFDPYAGTGTGI